MKIQFWTYFLSIFNYFGGVNMGKPKEPDWEFISDNEPDEETIEEFHRSLAQDYIDMYGVDNMKRVLEMVKQKNA